MTVSAGLKRAYGWRKQAFDPRDKYFIPRKLTKKFADTIDMTGGMGPQLDQGNEGSCFPPGTLIRMADGTERRIQDVRLLDNVLTAEGNVGRVRQVMVREHKEELICLQLWGHNHLKMTEEHPVLTQRGYVKAGKIKLDDWVAMPRYLPCCCTVVQTAAYIPQRYNVRQTQRILYNGLPGRASLAVNVKPVPDTISLTPGFGRIVGLFLAEGSTSKTKCVWTFNKNEEETLVAELVGLLKSELDVEAVVQPRPNNSTNVVLHGIAWSMLFEGLCSTGAGEKKLTPEIASGPKEFMAAVLQGWLDGDGHHADSGWKGTSVSHDLAMSMFDVAQALGQCPAIKTSLPKPSHGVQSRRRRWDVNMRAKGDSWRLEQDGKTVWRKVRGVGREEFSGFVYNLSVEGDNSYVAEGIGVHNCGPNTADELITYDQKAQGLPVVAASRLFIYYYTRFLMGTVSQDSGVDNRTMLQALAQYGFPAESLWPYDDTQASMVKPPTPDVIAAAAANLLTDYAAVIQSLSQMQGTLAAGRPFMFGFNVYQQIESEQAATNGILTDPGPNESPIGGHDVSICGVTLVDQPGVVPGNKWPANTFKFRNHWMNAPGRPWGDGGYGYVSINYATNVNLASDFWVFTTIPGGLPPPPPPPPPPGDSIVVPAGVQMMIPSGTYPTMANAARIAGPMTVANNTAVAVREHLLKAGVSQAHLNAATALGTVNWLALLAVFIKYGPLVWQVLSDVTTKNWTDLQTLIQANGLAVIQAILAALGVAVPPAALRGV